MPNTKDDAIKNNVQDESTGVPETGESSDAAEATDAAQATEASPGEAAEREAYELSELDAEELVVAAGGGHRLNTRSGCHNGVTNFTHCGTCPASYGCSGGTCSCAAVCARNLPNPTYGCATQGNQCTQYHCAPQAQTANCF